MKATGPDIGPIEAWKSWGEESVNMLWYQFRKVLDQDKNRGIVPSNQFI